MNAFRHPHLKKILFLIMSLMWLKSAFAMETYYFGESGDCPMCSSRAPTPANDILPPSQVPLNQNLLDRIHQTNELGFAGQYQRGIFATAYDGWSGINQSLITAAPSADPYAAMLSATALVPLRQPNTLGYPQFSLLNRTTPWPTWTNDLYTGFVSNWGFLGAPGFPF